jgi:predicted ATP-dependent endonuclease of OLD family
MPLEQFSIQNKDALRRAACENVPDIMVIAGPNGVGKSTLFNAIHRDLQRPSRNSSVTAPADIQSLYFGPHRTPAPTDIDASLIAELGGDSSRSQLSRSSYNRSGSSSIPDIVRRQSRRERIDPDPAPYFELKKRLSQLEFDRAQLIKDLYDRRGELGGDDVPQIGGPLSTAIDAVLPGINYEGVSKNDENVYEIQFNDRSGASVGFDSLSSGERDAIALLFNLVEPEIENIIAEARNESTTDEDIVALIDSPEAYLHPAMQERFLNFVKQYITRVNQEDSDNHLQVILCTHSQMMLQNADEDELFFLLYQDQREGNQLTSAADISLDTLESVTGQIGITALSAGNPILLVEGSSDREFLRRFFPDLCEEIEILPMGGKGKIIDFSTAFNQLVPELTSEGIFISALVDRDRDLDIDDEYAQFVKQLEVSCMENYLLDTRCLWDAIQQLTSENIRDEAGLESPADVDDLISGIVSTEDFQQQEIKTRLNERLRINVSVRHLDSLDEDSVKSLIDEVSETKKERVESNIAEVREAVSDAAGEGNYDELSGKNILKRVASRVEIDDHETLCRVTASRMQELEIQPELPKSTLQDLREKTDQPHAAQNILD